MADVRLGDAVTTAGPSRRIIAVLVVEFLVLVAGLTTAGVFAMKSTDGTGPLGGILGKDTNTAAVDQADAVSVARQFVLNEDAFTPANVKVYISNLMPLLTTKAQADLTNQYGAFQQAVGSLLGQVTKSSKAAAMPSAGTIQFAALASLAGTSATVIVAHDVLYGGIAAASCPAQPNYCQSKRWSVSLRKVGGNWLVDSFNPNV
ncbi:MAG: hypothetical protein ACTHOG_00065 [Marmoricola sp.]